LHGTVRKHFGALVGTSIDLDTFVELVCDTCSNVRGQRLTAQQASSALLTEIEHLLELVPGHSGPAGSLAIEQFTKIWVRDFHR
jgi:hypothetical protein